MTDDETVWYIPRTRSGRGPTLHTDRWCAALKGRREPMEKPRSLAPDHDLCKHCEGYERHRPTGPTLSDRLSKTDPEELGLSTLGDRE